MPNITISIPGLTTLLFVFLRVGAVLMGLPIFNSQSVPVLFRLALAFCIALILLPLVPQAHVPVFYGALDFGLAIGRELLIGFALALAVRMVFAGIQLAGQMAGYQMGLALANVIDPNSSNQVPVLAQFNNLLALLVFLIVGAHHWFILELVRSFSMIPLGGATIHAPVLKVLVALGGEMFAVAVKVGAPVIISQLVASVILGLIARTVPQMNVFIVAMPLQIGIGLFFMGVAMTQTATYFGSLFQHLAIEVMNLMRLMA
jgi:flagellar biosynthesis protein FliR